MPPRDWVKKCPQGVRSSAQILMVETSTTQKNIVFIFLKIPAKQCLVISNSFEVLLCREIAGRCSTGCHPQRFHSRMLTCFHHSPYIVPHHPTSRGVYGNHHHSLSSVVNQHPLSAASTVEYCFPPALAKIQLASSMETVGVGGSPAFAWQWLAGSSNQLGCSEMFQHLGLFKCFIRTCF